MIIMPMTRGMLKGVGTADPSFTSVVQLAHLNGSHGSTTITNSCPRGTTLVATNSASISTTQSKWGGASLRVGGGLDGVSDGANVADYGFGAGAFTIEWWQRLDGVTTSQNIIFFEDGTSTGIYLTNPGKPFYYAGAVNRITGANNLLLATTWQFVSYSKYDVGSPSVYTGAFHVDGVLVGSWTDTRNYGATGQIWVGRTSAGVNSMIGYIDDLRVTKGVGRYTTAGYSVPTGPLPNN